MAYTVLLDDFIETSGIDFSAVVAGIWVPAPSAEGYPGSPTFAGTAPTTGTPRMVTFPGLPGPPTSADAAMLISQTPAGLPIGHLYRLAGTILPQDDPVHLNGFCQNAATLAQKDLDDFAGRFGSRTFPVPGPLRTILGIVTLGLWIPTSVTAATVAITLPAAKPGGTLTVTITGTMTVVHWWWSNTNPWTFTETISVAPTGDIVDTSHIVNVTWSNSSMTITGGGIFASDNLGSLVAEVITPLLEAQLNQTIPIKCQ